MALALETGRPCIGGCGKPALGDDFCSAECARRVHGAPPPTTEQHFDVSDIYEPTLTPKQIAAHERSEHLRATLEWREEVRRTKAELEAAFGDLRNLPICPGCGRRYAPNPAKGKLYCTVLCGARTRHYLRQGRELPAETRRYTTGLAARDRNREIVRLREEEGWTLERIGDRFGITKERVSQILKERERGLEAVAA
jgi:Sigma-70, region 4